MKKRLYLLIVLMALIISTRAQPYIDSLFSELQKPKEDSNKVLVLCLLADYHEGISLDSNNYYVQKAVSLSEKINYPYGKFIALRSMFFAFILKANYTEALRIALESLNMSGAIKKENLYFAAIAHYDLSLANRLVGNQGKSLEEAREAILFQQKSGIIDGDFWSVISMKSNSFFPAHPDSALYYVKKAYELALQPHSRRDWCLAAAAVGDVYVKLGNYPLANQYYKVALQESIAIGCVYIQAREYRDLARIFAKTGPADSCIYYAQLALMICKQYNFGDYGLQTSQLLSNLYESQNRSDSALKYLKISLAARDSIFSQGKMQQFQLLLAGAEQKQRETTAAAERFQGRVKLYSIISIAVVFLILSIILYRNNMQKQKAYALIRRQKQETEEQKTKVEDAYRDLKSTQTQLIHAEKMASLGELTAGIAHEIQNPLNFVNNFSEVNVELIDELKSDLEAGKISDAAATADGIRQNLEKVIHHGQRADGIVKGMLEHSRSHGSEKELTDLNALAEEYLRLSYHSFRAKDPRDSANKTFNVDLKREFDSSLGKINIVPQDIGRVFQNLLNNAFHSVLEKKKNEAPGRIPTHCQHLNKETKFTFCTR